MLVDLHVFDPKAALRYLKLQLNNLSGISCKQAFTIVTFLISEFVICKNAVDLTTLSYQLLSILRY